MQSPDDEKGKNGRTARSGAATLRSATEVEQALELRVVSQDAMISFAPTVRP
jgi:hypothetical protein